MKRSELTETQRLILDYIRTDDRCKASSLLSWICDDFKGGPPDLDEAYLDLKREGVIKWMGDRNGIWRVTLEE